jgi:hypothetical protein
VNRLSEWEVCGSGSVSCPMTASVFAVLNVGFVCRRVVSYLDVDTRAIYREQNCRTSKEGFVCSTVTLVLTNNTHSMNNLHHHI